MSFVEFVKVLFSNSISMTFFAVVSIGLIYVNAEYNLTRWKYTTIAVLAICSLLLSGYYAFKILLFAIVQSLGLLIG